MTALALVQTLVRRRAIPASRVKDFRTSLQTLADACQVPLDDLPTMGLVPGQLTLAARHQEPIDPHKSR